MNILIPIFIAIFIGIIFLLHYHHTENNKAYDIFTKILEYVTSCRNTNTLKETQLKYIVYEMYQLDILSNVELSIIDKYLIKYNLFHHFSENNNNIQLEIIHVLQKLKHLM